MCLWLLTACLGLLPANTSPPIVIVPGVPPPILVPTTTSTTTATTTTNRPPVPGNMTMPTTPAPGLMTSPPMPPPGNNTATPPTTMMTTPSSTTASPSTVLPTLPPPTMISAPTSSTGGVLLHLILCNDPDVVCIINPDDVTGPLPIDPRLGTTPGPLSALRLQPVDNDYETPSYDTAVRFPRQKRNVKFISVNDFLNAYPKTDNKHEIHKRQSCRCVAAGSCVRNGTNYGAGMIDIRIATPVRNYSHT